MSVAVIRRATLQDYQEVMEIGITYKREDYLPYFYKEFITDPDYLCYVCVVDDKIVGFGCALIHDEGRAVQGRAFRFKESSRRKGYPKLMEQQLIADLADVPLLDSLLLVRARSGMNLASRNLAVEHIDSSNLYKFSISKSKYPKSRPSSSISRIYEKDLQGIFDTTSVCQKLFPQDLIYNYHVPFGLYKTNVRHIINDNTTVFVTAVSQHSPGNTEPKMKPTARVRPEDIGLLTIGWHYRAPAGQHCSISVFGYDLETFDSHIQTHIEHSSSSDDHLSMGFYTSETFPIEAVMRIFTTYGTSSFLLEPMCTCRRKLGFKCFEAKY